MKEFLEDVFVEFLLRPISAQRMILDSFKKFILDIA